MGLTYSFEFSNAARTAMIAVFGGWVGLFFLLSLRFEFGCKTGGKRAKMRCGMRNLRQAGRTQFVSNSSESQLCSASTSVGDARARSRFGMALRPCRASSGSSHSISTPSTSTKL